MSFETLYAYFTPRGSTDSRPFPKRRGLLVREAVDKEFTSSN